MDTLPPPPSSDEWELDVEDAFGEHEIEYWVWSGNRLIPATPNQIALIREREALDRLHAWNQVGARRERIQPRRGPFRYWYKRLWVWTRTLETNPLKNR